MGDAVLLPYLTSGDYSLYEARVGRRRVQVRASRTAMATKVYQHPIERIVSVVAQRYLEEHPDTPDGSVLPVMVTSTLAEQTDASM